MLSPNTLHCWECSPRSVQRIYTLLVSLYIMEISLSSSTDKSMCLLGPLIHASISQTNIHNYNVHCIFKKQHFMNILTSVAHSKITIEIQNGRQKI